MPTQLVNTSGVGTGGDDFMIPTAVGGPSTLEGGDGDDYIIGDPSTVWATGTSNSLAAPHNIDNSLVWTINEDPFIANSTTTPHTTLYVLADVGQSHFSSVTVGNGQTITVDIDFGNGHPIGVNADLYVQIYNSLGVVVATNDDGGTTAGGAGSLDGFDSFLTFTNTTGVDQVYTIRFSQFPGAAFSVAATFVANISVTGHSVTAPTVMGNDTLSGGNGDDTIAGQGGDDSISGDAGNDTLFGGSGIDSLNGGTGNDTVSGEGGDDSLFGDTGDDILLGGSGDDLLDGGGGSDQAFYGDVAGAVFVDLAAGEQVSAGAGSDTLVSVENVVGSNFNDTLLGDAAANNLRGGGGDDTLSGGGGDDTLQGEFGNDTLLGGAGNDAINDTSGNNTLFGGAGDDLLGTGSGSDSLYGGSGNDELRAGFGNDIIDGGTGIDTAVFTSGPVTVDLNVTTAQTTGAGSDTLTGIENLVGSNAADILVGNGGDNLLRGRDGNDALTGGDGNDTLAGELGDDNLLGEGGNDTASYDTAGAAVTVSLAAVGAQDTLGAGIDTLSSIENLTGSGFNDTLTGNGGNNILSGLNGNDNLDGGDGDDALEGGAGDDTLNGNNGFDIALYAAAAAAVTVNLGVAAAQNTGGAGTDTLVSIEGAIGSTFNDTLVGNAGSNTLNGGNGGDIIHGGAGDDSIIGGEGNDALHGNTGDDLLDGGNGVDIAFYSAAAAAVTVNLGVVVAQNTLSNGIDTLTGIENVFGSNFNDTLVGNAGANALSGGNGGDAIHGGAGNDSIIGGEGNDALHGNAGNDLINGGNGIDNVFYSAAAAAVTVNLGVVAAQNTGGDGIDTLTAIENVVGSIFNDTIIGDTGANTLNGLNGNDLLNGRAGNDTLVGGAGTDSFRFDTALNAATNVDTLSGFSAADDTILLSTAIFTAIGAGTLGAAAFQLGAAANDAGDRIIYDQTTGRIYYDADGNGAAAQVLFAQVAIGTAMNNFDFVGEAPAAEAPRMAAAATLDVAALSPWRTHLSGPQMGLEPADDGRLIQHSDFFFS